MFSLFGHHISMRAFALAVFENVSFIIIYSLSRILIFTIAPPESTDSGGHIYLLTLCCLIAFSTASACGLYNKEISAEPNSIISRLLTVSVLMYGLMALSISLAQMLFDNPTHLTPYYAITLSSACGYFISALLMRHRLCALNFKDTILDRRILVVGADECAAKIDYLNGASRSPYTAVGFVPLRRAAHSNRLGQYKILSESILDTRLGLLKSALQLKTDEIVVASRERRGLPVDALMECKFHGITVTEFASFWERQTGQIDFEEVNPSWLIFSDGFRMSRTLRSIKRIFDVVAATVLLLLTLPITIVAAMTIKLDGPGPIFYRQERVGINGAVFTIFKFRSMRTDAENDGVARWAQSNDARVTRVGRFLRRTRIDEIPQVLNVLLGSMSFVGPRPERPIFVEALTRKIPHYGIRHRIKPGITGWAQINYPYGASDDDARAKLAYDLYYAKNGGFFLDSVILFQTASVVLWPVGVR